MTTEHLTDHVPSLTGEEIVRHLVPPRQFADATLESYRPDHDYPSQAEAVAAIREFATGGSTPGGFFRKKTPEARPGIYLDGGFGVGKTHLLAALWHLSPQRKYFGTFIEYTALVGALGYQAALALLTGAKLICIDEFELDDPGDTRLMSRLLKELVAAQDFLREIDALSAQFTTIRIDGLDYRRRELEGHAATVTSEHLQAAVAAATGRVTLDSFDEVIAHLATVHPSKYVKLVDGISCVALTGVHELSSQTDALRFVAFVDRLYDAQVPVIAEGVPLDSVFADDMLAGGYRKKYLRAASRLIALTTGDGI
jgi:cell division protein ZapE